MSAAKTLGQDRMPSSCATCKFDYASSDSKADQFLELRDLSSFEQMRC